MSTRSTLQSIFFISLAASGCYTEPNFPDVPQITFKSFSKYPLTAGVGVGQSKRDSLVITIGFTDGNGDLGDKFPLNSLDSARYMQAGGWGNYKIRTFRLENNRYKEQATGENNFLIFPRLREGTKGSIKGDLELEQLYSYGRSFKVYPTKYRIQIRDRALNISNEIETDTIHLPFPN